MAIKTKYRVKRGTAYETIYFETSGELVVQDATHRFVSDAEKQAWNKKADKTYVDDIFESLQGSSTEGAISISAPIISTGSLLYRLGVGLKGELLLELIAEGTPQELILVSPNGQKWQVIVSNSNIQTVQTSKTNVTSNLYLQTSNPHGLIFGLGVDNDGSLVTSPICDVSLVDDDVLSYDKTWSSMKLYKTLNDNGIIPDIVTQEKNGLMLKEDKVKLDKINENDIASKAKVEELNGNINSLSNNKLDKASITISTLSPSGGKNGDIWIQY